MTIVVKGHVAQVTGSIAGMIEVSVQTAQAECGQVVVLKIPRQHAAHWLVGSAVQMTVYALPRVPAVGAIQEQMLADSPTTTRN